MPVTVVQLATMSSIRPQVYRHNLKTIQDPDWFIAIEVAPRVDQKSRSHFAF
jgi:hypothetical protein